MENLTLVLVIVVIGLLSIVGGQWILIWRLLDRLLMSRSIPSLGPVRATPPAAAEPAPVRKEPIMKFQIPD